MHGAGLQVFHTKRRASSTAAFPHHIRNFSPSYEKCIREKVSRELRKEVLQKNRHVCYCCDMKDREKGKRLELHHIVPVSFGGKTEADNLLPLCYNCHRSVHKLIDKMNVNPAKFKRSVLEDVVLQIASLRHSEKARQFGRCEPQEEGIMKPAAEKKLAPDDLLAFGLMVFVLSFTLSKKQFRILRKELVQRPWGEKANSAA